MLSNNRRTVWKWGIVVCFWLMGLASMNAQIILSIPEGDVDVNPEEQVCFPINIEGFNDVQGFQVGITYDTLLFDFERANSLNSAFTLPVSGYSASNGIIRILYSPFQSDPIDSVSGAFLEICFITKGELNSNGTFEVVDEFDGFTTNFFNNLDELAIDLTQNNSKNFNIVPVISNEITSINPSLSNDDGTISMKIDGGTGPYTIDWKNTATNETGTESYSTANVEQVILSGLSFGEYTFVISSADSPPFQRMDTVELSNDCKFSIDFEKTQPCVGDNNGVIVAQLLIDGVAPSDYFNSNYTVTWSDGTVNISNFNLTPGEYEVQIVQNSTGCTVTDKTILEESFLTFSPSIIPESCDRSQSNQGRISLNLAGSDTDYTLFWSPSGETTNTIDNLSEGSYFVQATSSSSCTYDTTIQISRPVIPSVLAPTLVEPTCPNPENGEIKVNLLGGSPTSAFVWRDDTNNVLPVTVDRLVGIAGGTYSWEATTIDGCSLDGTVTLGDGQTLKIDDITVADETCPTPINGVTGDGSIQVSVSGGLSPYSYSWSNNPSTPSTVNKVEGLIEGTYTVTVKDQNNCTIVSEDIEVKKPENFDVRVVSTTPTSCFDSTYIDGSATVTLTGGTPPNGQYWFNWSSGEMGQGDTHTALKLKKGENSVTITDENCQVTYIVDINSAPELILSIDNSQTIEPTCAGLSNGTLNVDPSGGTSPYQISWEIGETGTSLTSIPAGDYNYTIIDANGCSKSSFLALSEPDSVKVEQDLLGSFPITCPGDKDASIRVNVTGGVGNYIYTWSSGVAKDAESFAENLAPGIYTLGVVDANGCRGNSEELIVDDRTPITFSIPALDPIVCANGTTLLFAESVNGGAGGEEYTLSITASNSAIPVIVNAKNGVVPIGAGTYTLSVKDVLECESNDTTITILEPSPILIDLGDTKTMSLGDSIDITSEVFFTEGEIIYEWQNLFNPADTLCRTLDCESLKVSPSRDTRYVLSVMDERGCTGDAEVLIDVDRQRRISFPNVFSPESTGLNTIFGPLFDGGNQSISQINYFKIFDRWGNIVHDVENIMPNTSRDFYSWSGRYQNRNMPSGVYIYLAEIEFVDGVVLLYRGDVTLIR